MTDYVFSGTLVVSDNGYNLVAGDSLHTLAGSLLQSTGGDGVFANGGVNIQVDGDVEGAVYEGFAGIDDVAGAGDSTGITVNGSVGGLVGISVMAGPNSLPGAVHNIVNSGTITGSNDPFTRGSAIEVDGGGWIVNQASGKLSGTDAIVDTDASSGDINSFVNYGLVEAQPAYFIHSPFSIGGYAFVGGSDREAVYNIGGAIFGNVSMSSDKADVLYNATWMIGFSRPLVDLGCFNVENSTVVNVSGGGMYEGVNDSLVGVDMMTFGDADGDYLYNAGLVDEVPNSGNGNPASNAVLFGAGAADGLYNDSGGEVYGNVQLGSGAGQGVFNAGTIDGTVKLGDGAGDYYDGPAGKEIGGIVCGNGGDYVFTGSGLEVVTAGLGNDYFAMANGGETVIQELGAYQQSNGVDAIVNFQTYNAAAAQGTFLHLDASMAGATNFYDYNGGTLVQMNLGGGNYSYIDVLNTAVATVQAQTYYG